MAPVPGERSHFATNPLDEIAHAHVVHGQICDAMERIADGLPDEVDAKLCAQVASFLKYDIALHHHDEDMGLFPLLRARAAMADGFDGIVERLSAEHQSDTDFAGEIAESLELLGRGGPVGNPDMMGYMLRGFFERYRRHVQWEDALVMPLARLRLTEDDLQTLSRLMESNRACGL
jgi:hemerythrin-like domain-containing protein